MRNQESDHKVDEAQQVSENPENTSCHASSNNPTIASTPEPPYYAVIFTSIRTATDNNYSETAARMIELAALQDGFLGVESARDGLGITVSYWKDTKSIQQWKANCEHSIAQEKGKSEWYSAYKTRVCKVERDYGFSNST